MLPTSLKSHWVPFERHTLLLFQQEQSKALWKAVSSSQWKCVRVWETFSSWTPKEIYCNYFCQSFDTYFNKGFILDIYLSALLSHAHKQNRPTLRTLHWQQQKVWSIFAILRFRVKLSWCLPNCNMGLLWDAFASFTRIAWVAVVERGWGRGLAERKKTRLSRRLFPDHFGVAQ